MSTKYTKKTETPEKEVEVVEDNKKDEEVKEVKAVKKTTSNAKKKKIFDASEGVMCRSVVTGGLFLEGSKTKMPYKWNNYGDETEVEYRDLVALVREQSGYIYKPFFIIEDDDFIEEFPQLKKFYSENYSIKELSAILELPVDEMIKTISTLPKGAVDTLKKIAANQVSLGQIDSVRKIRALDDYFGTDLNLISEIFQNQ